MARTSAKKPPISIKNVGKSFDNNLVLQDINIDVSQGEIFGLIGLNGAGKTTLIKIMLGLLKQDKGKADLFGKEVIKKETRSKLSFLPEKFYPSPFLKGKEFLSLAMSYYGKKYNPQIASAGAKQLDLDPDALDIKITKYSKGMGQKLGLLSAFLINTPLLILDEPMSGLDPSARIKLKDSLINYAKKGKTIFFSSHILSDIDEICNRIAVLHDKRVIFTGDPLEFKKKYKSENLERAFLKAISAS